MKIIKNKSSLCGKKISDIFDIIGGGTPSTINKNYWNGDIHWISIKELSSNNINSSEKKITTLGLKNSSSKIIKSGNLILGTRISVGEVIIHNKDVAINQDLKGLILKDKANNIIYFKHLFKFNKNKLKELSQGLTVKGIRNEDLKSIILYIHTTEKQEKIAHVLSMQEEQIERIKGLLQKLEKRNQYYAEKLLSGELRIKENSETGQIEFYENEEWQEVVLNGEKCKIPLDWKIENILNIMNFSNGSTIKSEDLNYHNKGLPYLRTNEIWDGSTVNKNKVYFNGNLNNLELKNKDEYIVCFDGFNTKPGIGTLGLVTSNGEGICSNELKKIKNIEGISEYYVNVMILKNIRFQKTICKYAEGTTVKHAGKHIKHLKEVLIPIKEQKILNVYFQENLQKIDQLKNILPKEEKRFQWMLDNLLSGEYEIVD